MKFDGHLSVYSTKLEGLVPISFPEALSEEHRGASLDITRSLFSKL